MKTKPSAVVLILAALFAVSGISYGCYDPPPYVDITCPENGTVVVEGNDITIDVNAVDTSPGYITKVELYKGETLLGEDTNAPYSFLWNDANDSPDGNFIAKAYDDANQSEYSIPVTLSLLTIWYVDDDAQGLNNGSSWENAFNYLQDALDEALPDDQIRVAEGTYYPTVEVGGAGAQYKTFQLINDVSIYGGYAGLSNPTDPDERDIVNYETILSGDIGLTPADDSDNSYHVFYLTDSLGLDNTALLDGFTITKGCATGSVVHLNGAGIYCDHASPTIKNCIITDNKTGSYSNTYGNGGGMYNTYSSPTVTNCTFSNNYANISSGHTGAQGGGGMYNTYSSPTVTNCIFAGNHAVKYGGGMLNYSSSPEVVNCVFTENTADYGGGVSNTSYNPSSPELTNCTFTGNSSVSGGGGMFNYNYYSTSTPIVTNCIFWGDVPNDEIYNFNSPMPTFSYCDIKNSKSIEYNGKYYIVPDSYDSGDPLHSGGYFGYDGSSGSGSGGNIDEDPSFVNVKNPEGPDGVFGTWDDGLCITAYSHCVDRADSTADGFPETDITGRARTDIFFADNLGVGDTKDADIGAYESPMIWCVDDDASLGGDGSSWALNEAFKYLQDALAVAADGDEIWVAQGTYKPGTTAQEDSFVLVENVGVFGGFTGTETRLDERDFRANICTLSGDLTGNDGDPPNLNNYGDNSYHVVTGADNATLDGFTIKDGNSGNDYPYIGGPAIYCDNTSPDFNNCVIKNNKSDFSYGSAILTNNDCHPTFTNCYITENTRSWAMYNVASSPMVTNCVFSGNDEGALANVPASPVLTNCTFSGNGNSTGGAIINGAGYGTPYNPVLRNCILWGNNGVQTSSYDYREVYNDDDDVIPTFINCDIRGCGGSGDDWNLDFGNDGGNNIDTGDTDPFVNSDYPDGAYYLHLKDGSPCINTGNNSFVPESVTTDLDGNPRISFNIVDMGAYEYPLTKTHPPTMVVACSGRGTVVRINTETGDILGEYRSAPNERGKDPSRTTVDLLGNAWISNRNEANGDKGSVVKIGLVIGGTRCDSDYTTNLESGQYLKPPFEYNTCIDRDGDGLIKTSRELGDIRTWLNTGGADNNGGVSTADDEAILLYVRVNGTNARHVSIDKDNNVWVGSNDNHKFDLLDGATGTILNSFQATCCGYGGLIDSHGILWSSSEDDKLLRYDTINDTKTEFDNLPLTTYGLAVDTAGFIWNSGSLTNEICKFTPEGALYESNIFDDHVSDNPTGIAVSPKDNHVWTANRYGSSVSRFNNEGTWIEDISVGTTPTGVAVDEAGKVWVTNKDSDNVMRIDPALGAVDLPPISLNPGASPYNYSDMTGVMAKYLFWGLVNNLVISTSNSCEGCGHVIEPGEGTFACRNGSKVLVIAEPEPGYHFTEWTGSAVDADKVENPSQASSTVTVDANYELEANFASD